MKVPLVVLFLVALVFTSCSTKKPDDKIVVVGENVDSAAIAGDTAMQKAIEGSYEYSKSLTVSEKLVFDVIAYGGPPSKGDYAILRRGADNKADTVAHGTRYGIIANAFTADLNRNNNPEVYIVIQSADSNLYESIIAWEFDKNGKATSIELPQSVDKNSLTPQGKGRDNQNHVNIFLENYHIVRRISTGATYYYELKNTKLVLTKAKDN